MNLKFLFSLALLIISAIDISAEIIGDSIVAIYNNWSIKEEADYQAYSTRTKIQGNDSILEASSSLSTKILLKDTLPNGDLLFETTVQMPPLGELGEKEPLREYYERIYDILEKPQSFLTDSLGVMKDVFNYDSFREEMDSCILILHNWIHTLDMSEDQKMAMMNGVDNMIQQSLSKESMLENAGMFQYYGSMYEIGTTSYEVKIPVPFFNNQEVDAYVTFSCNVLEKTEESELVSIRTDVVYNSDQLMNLFASTFLSDDQLRKSGMLDPERPYISLTQTEEYIIEAISGTILQIESEKKSILPDNGRIDYSIIKMTDFK